MTIASQRRLRRRQVPASVDNRAYVAHGESAWCVDSWIRTIKEFNPATIRSVVEKSVGLLERRCIRLNGRDSNWRALFDEQIEEIVHASSPAEFESRMSAVISRGGLSHVAFFHQSGQRAPARYAINATFCTFDTPDGRRWLFEDVHEGGPAHAAGFARATYWYM